MRAVASFFCCQPHVHGRAPVLSAKPVGFCSSKTGVHFRKCARQNASCIQRWISEFWVVAARRLWKNRSTLTPKLAKTFNDARSKRPHIEAIVWEGKCRWMRRLQRSQSVTPGHSHAPCAGPPDICWLKGTFIGINSSGLVSRSFYKIVATDWQPKKKTHFVLWRIFSEIDSQKKRGPFEPLSVSRFVVGDYCRARSNATGFSSPASTLKVVVPTVLR